MKKAKVLEKLCSHLWVFEYWDSSELGETHKCCRCGKLRFVKDENREIML